MLWMVRSPRTWRSSPQPTVLLAPSRRTRRTWCWTSLLISRRKHLVRTIVDLINSSTSSLGQHQLEVSMYSLVDTSRCVHKGHHRYTLTLRPDGSDQTLTNLMRVPKQQLREV